MDNVRFPDLSVFSQEDVEQLKIYASTLISQNDSSAISEITKIISHYTSVGYETLLNEYYSVKAHRLGNEYVS